MYSQLNTNDTPQKKEEEKLKSSLKNIESETAALQIVITHRKKEMSDDIILLQRNITHFETHPDSIQQSNKTAVNINRIYRYTGLNNLYLAWVLYHVNKILDPLLSVKRKKLAEHVLEKKSGNNGGDVKTANTEAENLNADTKIETPDIDKHFKALTQIETLRKKDHPRQIQFLKTAQKELSLWNWKSFWLISLAVTSFAFFAVSTAIGAFINIAYDKNDDTFDMRIGNFSLTRDIIGPVIMMGVFLASSVTFVFSVYQIRKLFTLKKETTNQLNLLEKPEAPTTTSPIVTGKSSTVSSPTVVYTALATNERSPESIALSTMLPPVTTNTSAATPKPDLSIAIAPTTTSSTATTSTPAASEDERKNLLTEQKKSRCIIS